MAIRVRGKVKINLGSKIEIEVEIFLIFVLKPLKVQKAISCHFTLIYSTEDNVVFRMENITKRFGGLMALSEVNLSVKQSQGVAQIVPF